MAQVAVYIQNYNPTIKGVQHFDPHADAKVLRNAMQGSGTDEKAIVKILTTRSNQQIQQIRQAYAQDFEGKDLIRNIKDEIGGKFEDAAIALLLPRADLDAKSLNEAMKGMGTNEDTLIEIICTRTSDQLAAIAKSYDRLYDKSLVEIVKSEVGGDLQKLLLDCLAGKRDRDTKEINEKKAQDDANLLYQAGEKKWGTDENKFIEILTTRSFSHIHEINNQYNKLSKNTLEAAIKSEMSGDLAKALCTIVEYSRDPAGCWARLLSETMKGMGTDDKKLIRIMVTRAEIDLKSVRDVFGDRYGNGKTLESWIKSDTGGDYELILTALLLGNEQQQ